jgi:hypothetical protein
VSPNKELLMLQQENPSLDERTQLQLQAQHLIHNFQVKEDFFQIFYNCIYTN